MKDEKHNWAIEWIDMIYDPATGITTVTGASNPELLKEWQEQFHNHQVEIDPEYLNDDGTADARKKRLPKEWQEEWK